MIHNINLRRANSKDAPVLAEMRYNFLQELEENLEDILKLKPQLNEYFQRELLMETIVVWVAELHQKIIATSTMVVWKPPIGFSGIDKNGTGYILNMFTLAEYRKQGIARHY